VGGGEDQEKERIRGAASAGHNALRPSSPGCGIWYDLDNTVF
jgi:hypothetical protein